MNRIEWVLFCANTIILGVFINRLCPGWILMPMRTCLSTPLAMAVSFLGIEFYRVYWMDKRKKKTE